ncbi:MAG TPA: dipicolinate synthase subunit DpsA [Capillibacterium sp.]
MVKTFTVGGVAVLGGDRRQVMVAEAFHSSAAWVKTLGLTDLPPLPRLSPATSLQEALAGAEIIILPISGADDRGLVRCSDPAVQIKVDAGFFALAERKALLVTGRLPSALKQLAAERGIRVFEYAEHDGIAIPNAVPTAEGAIQLMMEETPFTVAGSSCLVLGFGRVARALVPRLLALGAKVTVAARNPAQLAEAGRIGGQPLPLCRLAGAIGQAEVVFNTIPALVLPGDLLEKMAPGTLVIDLASAPGGVDFEAAKRYGIKAILALGLPGKVAPLTAGRILATELPGLIKQELGRRV